MTGLHDLSGTIEAAADEITELIEAADLEALAYWYVQIQTTKTAFALLVREIENALAEYAPWSGGQWQPEGLPILELRRGKDRKNWRWDEVRAEMRKAVVDPKRNGGAILSTEQVAIVDEVLELVFEVAPLTPSTNPRATALRDRLGVDPDEYAEVKPGRVSVQVHQGDAA